MSPYRERARTADLAATAERPFPFGATALLLLSGFRLVVAAITAEECGAEVGLAVLLALLSAHALIAVRRSASLTSPDSSR